MSRRFLYHVVFSAVFGLFLILPDIIYSQINTSFPLIVNYQEIFAVFALSFLILMIRSVWIRFMFFCLFFLFSLSELSNYAYFGTLITPYAIPLVVSQAYDIGESFIALIGYIYAPLVLVMMIAVPALFALLRYDQKLEHNTFRFSYVGWIVTVLLFLGPLKYLASKEPYLFMPKANSYAIKNFYMASSLLIGREAIALAGAGRPAKQFAPYTVAVMNQNKPANNIIVIMGESLGSKRMSIFGFPLETTPELSALAASGKLIAREAIGSGVSTDVAVPTFFSLKREPENIQILASQETNLFRMAKERGYKVHYITTQGAGILKSFIGKYADVIVTKEDYEKNSSSDVLYDQLLVDYLKSIDLSKPNFIVLHQRNSHSPYEKYTPQQYKHFAYNKDDFHDFTIKTYANSVRYTDSLLAEMITYLNAKSPLPFMFFATSDHGELMGEYGKYGHSQLLLDVAKVPFLFAEKNGDSSIIKEVEESKNGRVTHYDIGQMIAHSIGYKVTNPNDNGERYINGLDISGQGGFIIYNKPPLQ